MIVMDFINTNLKFVIKLTFITPQITKLNRKIIQMMRMKNNRLNRTLNSNSLEIIWKTVFFFILVKNEDKIPN